MMKLLWSHVRNIRVEAYQNKIVYDIPLYNESILKLFKYHVEFLEESHTLRLTVKDRADFVKPTVSLTKELLN